MKSAIKKIKTSLPFYFHYKAFKRLVANRNSYLHQTGWFKSLEQGRPVDANGAEIPVDEFSLVKFLRDRLTKDLSLFEFGSGQSTIFYARLVKHVTSVESEEPWFQLVKKTMPENVQLIYQPEDTDGKYCRSVRVSGQKYDVIVVDGRDRVNCVRQSTEALSERGVLLLDDSHRDKYADAISHLKEKGFLMLPLEGLKPSGVRN